MSDWNEMATELAARRVERRRFLKGALGLGTLAMLESNKFAKALIPSIWNNPDPNNSGLETIVVTMMENRSLDHFLGWMGPVIDGIQAQTNPTSLAVPGGCVADASASPTVYPVNNATEVSTYHLTTHCLGSDPDHGWNGSRNEFNGGAMNGFMHQSGLDAMGYYKEGDVPFLGWMAKNYVTFSRYFSSVMGPTYPNRRYWISGNGGQADPSRSSAKGNDIPSPNQADPEPDGHDWPTIFHQLDQANIPWTYYHGDLATVMLFFNRVTMNPGKVRFIGDYFADAAAGLLTPVVFLDPSFVVWGNDDHPARDIMWGQRYMYDTFLALAQSPHWWNPVTKKGAAYILTYDEAGGFFDHVAPPRIASDPDASTDHCEDWGRLGFRVPTVVCSPFTKQGIGGGGMVAQQLYDHTSIMKFLQWRFNLGSLNAFGGVQLPNGLPYGIPPWYTGSRDNALDINNLNTVFDFNPDNAHPELPEGMPEIKLHALQGLGCAQSQFPEENGGENPFEGAPDPNAPPLARPRPPEIGYSNGKYVGPHADWVELADRGFFGKFDFRERAKDGVWRD